MELSKSKFSVFASLGSAKMRRKHGLFTAEGEKCVSDTFNSFFAVAIICTNGYMPGFGTNNTPIYHVSESDMKRISNLSTPSSIMAVYRLPDNDFEISNFDNIVDDLYLCLDGVQDPGNLGTIIRTCHWFGIKRIFASKDTVDIYNPKTVQSTMGSLAKVKITYCDLNKLFDCNRNMPVFGLLLDGKNLFKSELDKKGFIVMGNEGKGISPELRTRITSALLIPPAGEDHSESLNVAIATAITIAAFKN